MTGRWLVFLAQHDDDPCALWRGPHRHSILDDGRLGIVMERLPPEGVYVPGPGDVIRPEPTGMDLVVWEL